MTARDAVCAGLGALAFPTGWVVAHLIARKSVIYPYTKES